MSEKGRWTRSQPDRLQHAVRGWRSSWRSDLGATDELGLRANEDRLHVHDLHATILWLLGLDNMALVYPYKGRPERPTLNEDEPFEEIAG